MKKFLTVLFCFAMVWGVCAFSACGKEERTTYNLTAVYDEESKILTGTAEVDFYNCYANELSDLKFNLYGNAFREGAAFAPVAKTSQSRAYYNGASYGGMDIEGVEGCSGWDVAGEDENVLVVNLPQAVYPGERASVTVSYKLRLADVNHRTGVTQTTVNLGNFYPVLCAYTSEGFVECPYYSCGDPFFSDVADYEVELDAPESFVAAASGNKISESVAGGRRKTQYRLQNSRDFAIVLSKDFKVLSQTENGVEISYYYISDPSPEESLAAACKSFSYFGNSFGKYVYPTLSVVQTPFCYGGMEYPALTMIAEGQSAENNVYTIVHENAHQWWYAMVGSNQLTCAWQDEGLAEYSTLMFFENEPSYGYTRSGIVGSATRSYRAFFSVFSQLNGNADTTMTRNLGAFSSEFEYTNVTYNKGLLLFDTLRDYIGDDNFCACLKKYFSDFCGKTASAEDMIAAFAEYGADVEPMFRSFLEGKILI